jgi:hypothetical protein
MTAIERTQAISDLLENNLPPLLATAGLDNFDVYQNKAPLRSTDLEMTVIVDYDEDDVDLYRFGVLIAAQLYGKDQAQEYHSIIMEFLREFLTGSVVGIMERNSIKGDPWPIDLNSTSFCFYEVGFSEPLDKCD